MISKDVSTFCSSSLTFIAGFNIFAALCSGIGAYRIRRYVQQRFNIKESEDASMMAVGLCGCCAVAQDAHELMKRGIIPSLAGGSASEQQPMQPTNQMSVQQPSPVYPPGGKENV